jgi:hypothetical protein
MLGNPPAIVAVVKCVGFDSCAVEKPPNISLFIVVSKVDVTVVDQAVCVTQVVGLIPGSRDWVHNGIGAKVDDKRDPEWRERKDDAPRAASASEITRTPQPADKNGPASTFLR